MRNKWFITLLFLLFTIPFFGQTPGLIIKPAGSGANPLDPNGDGYASVNPTGYINNDYEHTETELPFVAIVRPDPPGDPVKGPSGMFNDIVGTDGAGENAIFTYTDGTNIFFRFRLDGYAPNSKTYSIFIDTDQKFGFTGPDADPNAVSGNPGFEVEISLHTNFTVSIYNINGTTIPSFVASYPYETHCQKSIAYTTNSGNPDYFYDFYVPLSAIPGVNSATPLRYVALTTMNPNSAIDSNAQSDVGGTSEGNNLDNVFNDLIGEQTPTVPGQEVLVRSECPTITGPILTGATSVSGTTTEGAGTIIRLYINGVFTNSTTTSGNNWQIVGLSALQSGKVVTATAQASGKGESTSSCNGVIVGGDCAAPVVGPIINGKGICGDAGAAVAGALIKVYDANMQLVTANPANPIAFADGSFVWSCNGNTNNCNSGGNCMADGRYYITQAPPGQCESQGVWVCLGTTGTTATPVINTPVYTTDDFVTGTGVAGATVYLFNEDGGALGSAVVNGSGIWSIDPTSALTNCMGIYANQLSAANQCISANTAITYVLGGDQAIAPVIFGADCVPSASLPLTSVSGFSVEAEGTTIEVFNTSGPTLLGTTTVNANGTWTLSSVSINAGTSIYAIATDLGNCREESDPSETITVTTQTALGSLAITTIPITENVSTIIEGNGTAGATINLYIDEYDLLGTTTVSGGGTWSVSITASELYAGGLVQATQTSSPNCESDFSAAVQVQCQLPSTSFTLTPVQTGWCEQDYGQFTINSTESGVIYTPVYAADNTVAGYSILGTGGVDVISTYPLTTDPTLFKVKALKISSVSCETIGATTVSIEMFLNPANKTLSASATNLCGGQTTTITIQNFDTDVSYTLQNQTTGATIPSSSNVNGLNLELTTNPLYDNVIIQVQGEKLYLSNTVSCTSIMATTFNITISGPQTNQAVYSSDAVICHSGSTNINVNTYNDGFTYRIYRASDDTQLGTDYTGNGNTFSVSTGTIIDTETYYVTINDGGGCGEIRLPDEVTVLVSKIDYVLDSKNDVSCYGDTNGSINISITGNVSTPTYSWSHGPSTQDVANLEPNDYTITITDGGFCSFQETFTINEPDLLTLSAITTQNDDGTPGGSGVIAIVLSGGTSDFTISWNGPETGSINIGSVTNYNIQNLMQGDYDVTVSDGNGCTADDMAYIGDASSLIINATITPVSCFGGSNGEIDLHVGPPGATYTVDWEFNGWDDPDTDNEDQTGLTAGNYRVVVTNTDNNNRDTLTFAVTQPAAALNLSETVTQILCYGDASGSIDITVSGGTTPYTYSWIGPNSFSSSSANLSNLGPGTYTLVVTDDRGCIISNQYTITQPDPISISLETTHVTTFGGSNGAIASSVSGGAGTYTYNWSHIAGNNNPFTTVTGLTSGSYTLYITDQNGCTASAETYVSQPVNTLQNCQYVIGDNFETNNYSGKGGTTGNLDWVNNWTRGGELPRTSIASATCPNTSYALLMGTTGNAKSYTAYVERTADLSVFESAELVFDRCVTNAGNGVLSILFNGNLIQTISLGSLTSSPYSYTISIDNSYLTSGFTLRYSLYSSNDGNTSGGIFLDNIEIRGTKAFEVFAQPQHVTCYNGSDGGATITINPNNNGSIGIPTYTYAWNDPGSSTTQNLSNVAAGNYSVTITDFGACVMNIQNIVVTAPLNPISASISITHPTCPGDTDGSISVDGATNGNSTTYQYRFTDNSDVELQAWSTTNNITGLGNGTYKAYARNGDGTCATLIDGNITLEGVDNIKPTIACHGTITRTANASGCGASVTIPTIGNAEVSDNCASDTNLIASLEWSSTDGGFGTGQIGTRNFPQGTTTVTYTITDDEGNFNTCSFNVVVNTDVNVSTFSVTALDRCLGLNGSVTIGGSLADGTYNIDYDLSGANSGSYSSTLTVAGGTGLGAVSITSSYLTNTGTTTFTITSLSRNCTVTTFSNDNDSFEVIPIPGAPTGNATQYFCSGNNPVVNNLSITSEPSSIVRWYDASSGGNSVTGNTALSDGTTYYASQEVNGCESTLRLAVSAVVYNSPSSAVLSGTASICNGQSTNLTVSITDGTGPFTVVYNNGASDIQIDNYNSGGNISVSPSITTNYALVSVTDNNNCSAVSLSGSATVTVNNGPTNAVLSGSATICSGSSTNLTVSITGGTGPFTIVYNNGTGNNTVNNYNSGDGISVSPSTTTSYTLVSVSDANGCTSPSLNGNPTITVNNSPTSAVLSLTNSTICNGNNTNLVVTITGGTGPYSVTYFNGTGNTTVSNYNSGNHISISPSSTTTYSLVSVTDANGCAASSTSGTPTVTVNNGPSASVLAGTNTICQSDATNLTITITGGATPYTVVYNNGTADFTIFNYSSGNNISVSPNTNTTYTLVSVTDNNGCTGSGNSGNAVITVNPTPNFTIDENPEVCMGETTASLAYSNVENSPNEYSIEWSAAALAEDFINITDASLPASPFSITVPNTASNATYDGTLYLSNTVTGCSNNGLSFSVIVNICITITQQPTNQTTCAGSNAAFTITSDGTTWQWQYYNTVSTLWEDLANDAAYSGVTTAELTVIAPGTGMNGYEYRCVVGDGSATVNSSSAILTVNPLPNNSYTLGNPDICFGANAIISISGSELGVDYQLRLNSDDSDVGSPVAGTGSAFDFTVTPGPETNTSYNVLATNTTTTCSVELTNLSSVVVKDPSVTITILDQSKCPDLDPALGFVPENSTYNAGGTAITFRVTRVSPGASEWNFDYSLSINTSTLRAGSPISSLTGSYTNINTDDVDMVFHVVNQPGQNINAILTINNVDADGCTEDSTDNLNHIADQIILPMPIVGAFD